MLTINDEITQTKQFSISLDVYEGPIDLLLELARKQKVDLSDVSILELAEQYIQFINKYQDIHLEIAADYLVMAAWLTYLKSRLLLPKEEKTENYTPEELEDALKYQLQRLEAYQSVSKQMYSLPLLGRDTFYGGSSEGVHVKYDITYSSTLFDLLKSYSLIIQNDDVVNHLTIASSELYSVDMALKRLKDIFGDVTEWTNLLSLIPQFNNNKIINKSILSSNLVASLELAKNGYIDVKQNNIFGNIFVKLRK